MKHKDKIIQKLAELLAESNQCKTTGNECVTLGKCLPGCFITWAEEQINMKGNNE